MKIKSVRIKNFRSFNDETIDFEDYTCFVGANGSGKSTVLNALNVFFRQYKDSCTDLSRLSEDDFHHKNTEEDIEITVTFKDLSEAAKEDLAHYVRQDKLTITSKATFNPDTGRADVVQHGERLGIKDFEKYFLKDEGNAKADELKDIYESLRGKFDLPAARTKPAMKDALEAFQIKFPEQCVLIQKKEQFYGWTKGENRLSPHVQWVFVSASKDVTEEGTETKDTALEQLLKRTVRSKVKFKEKVDEIKSTTQALYQEMLDQQQDVLDGISESLEASLEAWAHPGITARILWRQDSEKSVKIEEPLAFTKLGERGFESELGRFGHGLQRSFLLALLQEVAKISDETAPTLIMGIEEPEIYQHPPQARFLAETLRELSASGSQIIACSHSPLFIPGDNFEAVRIVRETGDPSVSSVTSLSYNDLAEKLKQTGQSPLKEKGVLAKLFPSLNPTINEMFFCGKLVLTEGIEDIAYISTYLMLMGHMETFRKNGGHIVPAGGKSSIIKPLAVAKLLKIPAFVVFDADTHKDDIPDQEKRDSEVGKHKKDNKAILSLQGYDRESEWPEQTFLGDDICMWKTEITRMIKTELGTDWQTHVDKAEDYYGQPGGLQKNPLCIARALENAWQAGVKSPSLLNLIDKIINFVSKG